MSKLALVPYIVAQVEIAGHSHPCRRKARRRPSQPAAGRLAVTSVAQDKRVTAAFPPPATPPPPEESGRAETRMRDLEARGEGAGGNDLNFTRLEAYYFQNSVDHILLGKHRSVKI